MQAAQKFRVLLVAFLTCFFFDLVAQPMAGIYTVGSGGTYATLTAAVTDLTTRGINNPVTFKLKTGTFNEQVSLPAITGTSTTNVITFEAESGNAADVILTFAPTNTNNYIVRFDNASFITLRNLSLEPTGPTYTRAIHAINNINDLTFENLTITLPSTTSVTEDRTAILARPTVSTNLRFLNNTIMGGSHGILHVGNNSNRSAGTVITGNTLTNVYARPVYLEYMNGVVFNDNVVNGSTYSDYYGVTVHNSSGYLEMLRNRITGGHGYALRMYYPNGSGLIANNFFQSASTSGYQTVYILYGLNNTNFYHNSVSATGSGEAFHFDRYQSTGNRIVNNIFSANSGLAVNHQTPSAVNSVVEMDYNDLFTSGSFLGRVLSTNYGTLEQWRTGSGFDASSVFFDPQFASATNLTPSAPGIASAGKNLLADVPTDIDGGARTTTPSLGAKQFSAAALNPLSGTYTIGTGAFDYPTITAAIDAMRVNGINGPVTFLLTSQTFNERFTLPAISGSSASNPILFQAQSGTAADVILTAPAATNTATNYIALLSNAAFVSFKNLTFQPATSTAFQRSVYIENRADDITFENLIFTLPTTTSITEDRAAVIARPTVSTNIRFLNNTIMGGSHGILHVGNNSNRSAGTVITGNTLTNVYARPVYLEYMNGVVFNDNVVNGSIYSDYHGVNIRSSSGYLEMQRNRITGGAGYALYLYYPNGSGLIANNFFHSTSTSGYQTVYILYGLNNTNFYHNSVSATGTGEAFHFDRYQSTGNRIVNNIFSANSGLAVNHQTPSAVNSVVEMDYNDLFTSGPVLGRVLSTNYGTLEQWRTGSGFDTNSVFFDPQFASATNLTPSAPGIASAGKNLLADVPTDIDGGARTTTPSLGAKQFSAAALNPLSGTYTIGTGAFDYPTITAAIDAMRVNGINGPVTFLLTSQTFNERFTLPAISGSSASNPILFQAQSGTAADVILTAPAATNTATNYIALLSNAAFVSFKNLTFQPATSTAFQRSVYIENRADDITFENLIFTLPTTTSITEDRAAVIARPTVSTNIRFLNNTIMGGSHGILHVGNNSNRSAGTVITGNTLTNVYARPVYLEYMNGVVFNDNVVNGSIYSDYHGVNIRSSSGYLEMQRNRITGGAGYALYLYYPNGSGLIANNFFHSTSTSGYQTVYILYGLNNTNFYHNSVSATGTGEAFHFDRYQSTGNRIVNNIFSANSGLAVNHQTPSAVNSVVEMDYNDLFTSGSFLGRVLSTNYGTLAAWQTGSGFDASSLSIDPQFLSSTSLYTAIAGLSASGKNVNNDVPDDIDGLARPSTPSIGANQFGASGTPLTGDYTINAAGSGTTNFTTFTAALDALKNFGVSGPVVFKITGDFNEQLTFLSISGASSTNTITFESASGNVADAIIRHSATSSATNFTVRLSNADHHRFRNLTIFAEGTTYGRAVQLSNRTIDIRFEGNTIESVVTTSTTSDRGGIFINSAQAQDVHLINNLIRFGSYGISFQGPGAKATGTLIQGNTIYQTYYRGIALTYQTGFLLDNNLVTNNPSATGFNGINISYVDGSFQITANKVTGGNGTALDIYSGLAAAGSPALIANNFLQSNNNSGFQTVALNYLEHVNFYHNNINATGTGSGLYYASSGSNVSLVNNNFKANGYSLQVQTPAAIAQINYNNYFTTGATLARWNNIDQTNLANLQTANGQDANSLSVDPLYQTETDLQALASSLAGAGLDVTAIVPTDINGTARTVPVSIGATQYVAAFAKDASLTEILQPTNSCSLTNAENIRVEISNLGATSISGFQVAYQINGGTAVIEPVPTTILPGGKLEYTFTQQADLAAKQVYTIKAYVILATDENIANDELEVTITHYPDLVTTLTGDATLCQGSSISLTATGGSGYLWSTGATASSITVSPSSATTYSVLITNADGCSETKSVTITVKEIPVLSYTNDVGYTTSFVNPAFGNSEEVFEFRMIYTDANGNFPASGYPRVELDANGNGQVTDPLDLIRVMIEADATDTNVIDGKEYRVSITGLSDLISWRSRIVANNTDGCPAQSPFVAQPFVSNDLLDVAIYANDISFSKSNPAINESIKIYARIRNTSDFVAQNFVVTAYIEDIPVFTQTVLQLNPQSSITLQWDQVFSMAGFFPVKVVIDETNVLAEDNELNNFAIRPILTGDYQLPGGIDPDAIAAPLSVQPLGLITITGKAQYYGIEAGIDPDVAGATAIVRIAGGSQSATTTQADGTYVLSVIAPANPGTYTLTVEVTDYTLTGYEGPITFTVLPAPPKPDLSTYITLNKTTILPGETISGTAVIQNVGAVVATNFVFRYLNCDVILGEEAIALLNPGESLTYTFTTTTGVIGDCFNRNNCLFQSIADATNQVTNEITESNNSSGVYLTVLPDKPDLTPINITNQSIAGFINMLNPFTFYVRVDNIGGVDATSPFNVNVYMDNVLIRTESLNALATCAGHTFTVTHNFTDVLDHVLDIRVDEPIGSGVIDEYRETNNEFSRIIKHVPPPPQYPNLNVGNHDLSVNPVLPPAGSNFDINVTYRNNGPIAIAAPYDLELTVIEAGVPRIETRNISTTLNPGATNSVTLTTSLLTDGDHAFRIRLDNNAVITESTEADNIAQMPLCVDFGVSPAGGAWNGNFYVNTVQTLTASIYNYGLFTATNVAVTFYLDNVEVATLTLPTVAPGLQAGSYAVSTPYLFDQVGTFELKVVVDAPGVYTECREDNNEYKNNIVVRVPAPDLRIFSEYISPSKINPDVAEPISIFLSYDNMGVGATGPFKARILVDDVQLGPDIDIPSIPSGEDGTVEVTTPYASSTAGIRIIRAFLDPDNLLTETSETNNEASRALVVGQAPNLLFVDLEPSIDCPNDGDNITISASVFNIGDLDASAEVHFFYITESDTIPIDTKNFALAGKDTILVQTDWLVINKTYHLYAEIRNSDPQEFDITDNFILTKLCGGPYYNLFVSVEGQGIVKKTPNANRFEGVQEIELTATPIAGWQFTGWQGDATGITNPLVFDLTSDQTITALFSEVLAPPTTTDTARCDTGSVILRASGATATQTYAWYDLPVGGTLLQDLSDSTFVTPVLSATTSYWVTIKSTTSESARVEAIATIHPLPLQPAVTVTGDLLLCEGEETTTLDAPGGFTQYLWSTGETTTQIIASVAGSYSVQVTDSNGCQSVASTGVDVAIELCSVPVAVNGTRCGSGIVTLSATGANGAQTYAWYDQAVGGTLLQDLTSPDFITPALTTTTSYFVSIRSATLESSRVEVVATIETVPGQPVITIQGTTTLCPEKLESASLEAPSGFSQYLWSTGETSQNITVTQVGSYTVQVAAVNGCLSIPSTAVDILTESCSEIVVYNAVSANADALNSYLRIENIDSFPETANNTLKIFNRWGDLVFETTNYDNVNNRFTGNNKNGDPLPPGTYYYVLEFSSGRKSMNGYLSLKR